jgi:molybdenum cofactor cytidylyltransferase
VIDRLAQAFADRAGCARPWRLRYSASAAIPVLLARKLFTRRSPTARWRDEGARRLLDAAGDAIVEEIALDDPAIALDVDTPEALRRL